jgi:hypothetical protein
MFCKSLAISLASVALPYFLEPLSTAQIFTGKDKMCFDFPCDLNVKLFSAQDEFKVLII